jgi:hypothetical protein
MKLARNLGWLAASFALLIGASICQSQSLKASEAKAHLGETATVCGIVAGEHTATGSRGEPTFINLDSAYPDQVFTILVWGSDRPSVGELPKLKSHVCATGLIEAYHGLPQIVVRSGKQLGR